MEDGIKKIRMINPQDYPDIPLQFIAEYNGYLRELSEENKKLKTTIAKLMGDIGQQEETDRAFREQMEIVSALSREYLNVYQINARNRTCKIIKLEGYITEGIEVNSKETYSYNSLVKQYIQDRVYPADADLLSYAMSLENVIRELNHRPQFVSGYRALVNGEIHYFQFKYIKLEGDNENGNIIAAFKNIDSVVNEAKERTILKAKAESDLMTGLLNRGSGQDKATEKIRSGCGGMLCIIDIDKFKSINDTYGHNVGDRVIISVAECLKSVFRKEDVVFRLGGDEFSALAPNVKSKASVKRIMDRFFSNLEQIDIPELGNRKITTSVGVVMIEETSENDFTQLYQMADSCLYRSKEVMGNAATIYNK